MPDITMCKGEGCGIKEDCYRHTAKANEHWQTYFTESPCSQKMGGTACEYFTPNRRAENEVKL